MSKKIPKLVSPTKLAKRLSIKPLDVVLLFNECASFPGPVSYRGFNPMWEKQTIDEWLAGLVKAWLEGRP